MKTLDVDGKILVKLDDADWEKVKDYKWSAVRWDEQSPYKPVTDIDGVDVAMHRFLTGAEPTEIVVHLDKDVTNNQRNNLSVRTKRGCMSKKPANAATCIQYDTKLSVWKPYLETKNGLICLGEYGSQGKAVKAYNEGAVHFHGPKAWKYIP